MVSRIVYEAKESVNYIRTFATTAVMNKNTSEGVVIDFHEEYIKPRMPLEHNMSEILYNYPEEELYIVREKQTSVTMSRENALLMAKWILNNLQDDDDEIEEDDEVDYEYIDDEDRYR